MRSTLRVGPMAVATLAVIVLSGCSGISSTPDSATRNLVASPTDDPVPLGAPDMWDLTFRDEFEGSTLKDAAWTPTRGGTAEIPGAPFNLGKEAQGFDQGMASVSDGMLNLRAARTPITIGAGTSRQTVYPYTSGMVQSGGKVEILYGFVEARLKVPGDRGYWPAFWLVPSTAWPPEIDVAEFGVGRDSKLHPYMNVHWGTSWSDHRQLTLQPIGDVTADYAGAWHTYGLRWDAESIQVFVDGVPGRTFALPTIPSTQMSIVLNLSVRKGTTPPSRSMHVDYVRVWAPAEQ